MNHSRLLFLLILLLAGCRPKEPTYPPTVFEGKPEVPASILREHAYLLQKIDEIARLQDSTGIKAKEISSLMKNHFQEEEDFVFPPLGLLPSLSEGTLPAQTPDVIMLIERFESESAHMSAEHQLIKALMDELLRSAMKEAHPEVRVLADALHKHAAIEEEVLFPTVVLIGAYLSTVDSP